MSSLLRIGAVCLVISAGALRAQDTASLTVTVCDPTNAFVPGAKVTLTDLRKGSVREALTTEAGYAAFDALPPSNYSLDVGKAGFDNSRVEMIALTVRDRQRMRVDLKVASEKSSITITDSAQGIGVDASEGVEVDQNYVQNLPLNGREPVSLVRMSPGITSAEGSRGGGGFNSNGLRANMNYFTLDGLSLNGSVGPMGGGGGFGPPGAGGGAPPIGGGSAGEVISIDSLQEMRVQTSPFAPEFGRSPGAQIAMTSRGGGNDYHGSLSYYLRNENLNANDWFGNTAGEARGTMRQKRPAGTFGGSLVKDKTFFFLSYEALRLLTPTTLVAYVPNQTARKTAPWPIPVYLNAFPQPNGADLADDAALFRATVTNPSTNNAGSLRLDESLGAKSTLFLRYSMSPSAKSQMRGSELSSPSVLTRSDSQSKSASIGWTYATSSSMLHDLRVNYSSSTYKSGSTMDTFGGAVPLTDSLVFPAGVTSLTGQFNFSIFGVAGYSYGDKSRNEQKQWNAVYSLTRTRLEHSYKFGIDVRRIDPTIYRKVYSQSASFDGITGTSSYGTVMSGVSTNAQVGSYLPAVYPSFTNFSAYGQDTWRFNDRATFTYGLRWDVNPAPGARIGPLPYALSSSTVAGVTQNEPIYPTKWGNVAPRVGVAYEMDNRPGHEMVARIGFGSFYDLGYGVSSSAFGGAPYANVQTITSAPFPLLASDAAPPVMPPVKPYGLVTTASADLQTPIVYQWNFNWEHYYGQAQSLSISYVGTKGSRLMLSEMQPIYGDNYDILMLASNGAQSNYNALQMQFRRRLSQRVQTQFSYTWGHSTDSASNDMGGGGGFATLTTGNHGASDFDVRHNLNWTGSYRLPSPKGMLHPLIDGWYVDWAVTARSGLPFDVEGTSQKTSNSSTGSASNNRKGLFAMVRPNFLGIKSDGTNITWLKDDKVPGRLRLNSKAFKIPTDYSQGNLGRNALRGFAAKQVDFALRRELSISETWRLNLAAQAFNATNHPNFANPSPMEGANLSSPNFGVMTRMLGGGGSNPGANSVYQSGAPRSIEISVRLQF